MKDGPFPVAKDASELLICTNENHDDYPVYGVGPHHHVGLTEDPKSFIGSTRPIPKEEWPTNYREDPDEPGLGTWLCPECNGRGIRELDSRGGSNE